MCLKKHLYLSSCSNTRKTMSHSRGPYPFVSPYETSLVEGYVNGAATTSNATAGVNSATVGVNATTAGVTNSGVTNTGVTNSGGGVGVNATGVTNSATAGVDSATAGATDPAADPARQMCDAEYTDKIQQANQAMFALSELNSCDPGTQAAAQYNKLNTDIAQYDAHFYDVLSRLNQAVKNFDAAVKLDKNGEYMSTVIRRNIDANERYIGDKNSDIMTAQRLVVINRQTLIYYIVVCEYLRTVLVFFCIGIILSFITQHKLIPYVYFELILAIIGVIFFIVLVVRIFQNLNHYNMLYQERVFYYDDDMIPETADKKDEKKESCPVCPEDVQTKDNASCMVNYQY